MTQLCAYEHTTTSVLYTWIMNYSSLGTFLFKHSAQSVNIEAVLSRLRKGEREGGKEELTLLYPRSSLYN